jgi:uncharacterized protein YihD (DUF1040 family)
MRDPRRIDAVLATVRRVWTLAPDLRLCQLLSNAMGSGIQDLYHVEDDVLTGKLNHLQKEMTKKDH